MLSKQRIFALGFQQVLAMYAGAVVVPLIIGQALNLTPHQMAYLIAADLFTCGLATLLQVYGGKYIGAGLPVMLGCTFTAVGPIIAIASTSNLATAYGAIIISGIFVFLFAPLFGKLLRFFPKVVTGTVVTIIGLSLIPVAMKNAAGGEGDPTFGSPTNLILALLTLLLILFVNRMFTGFIRSLSVLIGLIAGTMVAYLLGMVSFGSVTEASWVSVVQPFYFGTPEFNISAILTMILVNMISMVESTGVYFAVGKVTDQKIEKKTVVKGLRAEGLAITMGGVFNAFPYTAFSQNVGLLSLTGIKGREAIMGAGAILVVLGMLPKLAALTTVIPNAVLGGAMIAMFGMVVASGVNMLSAVDLKKNENMLIIACSIGVGLGSAVVPQMFEQLPIIWLQMLLQNGIVTGSITAIVLNLLLNFQSVKDEGNQQPVIKTQPSNTVSV
ncbi:nucleobase:cation symporter-2 family protein [Brevibacillus daliensis]|uniref:nucleobase:cation symporter-2 family protein n=1 Tax=Brevibacillus daliensis TaxID=2892995 RepID=UPI001E45A598|nr:nucleobase:cation symporter-2 family protein [Brevibacillus daliensis]